MNLQSDFLSTCEGFGIPTEIAIELWIEVTEFYAEKGRYYHNLQHLVDMHQELIEVKNRLTDFPSILFALAYHDIIYRPKSSDNEAQSATFAEKIMFEYNIPYPVMKKVSSLIHATKSHQSTLDPDVSYFLDADLSVLGKDTATYLSYSVAIRKEFKMYPDFLYKPGRKKILLHFLEMERIYKTDHFYNKYEEQARKNILLESISLS